VVDPRLAFDLELEAERLDIFVVLDRKSVV